MSYEFEFYHGVALCRLIHDGRVTAIKLYSKENNSAYVINDGIGIYLKYCTKRMSPWQFTFSKVHCDEIFGMIEKFRNTFLVLVCQDDGIACLNANEIKMVLDHSANKTQGISVARRPREKYGVSGKSGRLNYKFSDNFPVDIFANI